MKHLTIIAALAASPALADGPSTFSDPVVSKPRCVNAFLFWKWESDCAPVNASDSNSDRPDSPDVKRQDDPHDPMMPPTSKPPSHKPPTSKPEPPKTTPKPPSHKPPTTTPPKHEPPSRHPSDASQGGNNGWGNGSQDAPGSSGLKNNAENGPKGKNDGRGKNSGNSGKKK